MGFFGSSTNLQYGGIFDPLNVPGLQFYLDGSDRSRMTLPDPSAVSQVNNKADSAAYAYQTDPARQPAQAGLSLSFDGGDELRLDALGTALLKNVDKFSIVAEVEPAVLNVNNTILYLSTGTDAAKARFSLYISSGNLLTCQVRRLDTDSVATVSGTTGLTTDYVTAGEKVVIGVTVDLSANELKLYKGGYLVKTDAPYATTGATSNTDSARGYIGSSNGGSYFNGKIHRLGIFPGKILADAEREYLERGLARTVNARIKALTHRCLVFEGDSITANVYLSASQRINSQVHEQLGQSIHVRTFNYADPGDKITERDAAAAAGIDAITYEPYAQPILIFLCGTNDLFLAPTATPATVLSRLQTYINNRRATGKYRKIYIGTLTKRSDDVSNLIGQYNDLLYANYQSMGVGLIDFWRDPLTVNVVGENSAPNTPTYWSDFVHPNAEGIKAMALLEAKVLRAAEPLL